MFSSYALSSYAHEDNSRFPFLLSNYARRRNSKFIFLHKQSRVTLLGVTRSSATYLFKVVYINDGKQNQIF